MKSTNSSILNGIQLIKGMADKLERTTETLNRSGKTLSSRLMAYQMLPSRDEEAALRFLYRYSRKNYTLLRRECNKFEASLKKNDELVAGNIRDIQKAETHKQEFLYCAYGLVKTLRDIAQDLEQPTGPNPPTKKQLDAYRELGRGLNRKSVAEVAKALGCSPSAIYQRLKRFKKTYPDM